MNPAALLINALTPEQRASLFQALKCYQAILVDEKNSINDTSYPAPLKQHLTSFYDTELLSTKHCMENLFHHCFTDDLDPVKLFAKNKKTAPLQSIT